MVPQVSQSHLQKMLWVLGWMQAEQDKGSPRVVVVTPVRTFTVTQSRCQWRPCGEQSLNCKTRGINGAHWGVTLPPLPSSTTRLPHLSVVEAKWTTCTFPPTWQE